MTDHRFPEPARTAIAAEPPPDEALDPTVEVERELARLRGREATWRQERRLLLAALNAAEREIADLPALRRELSETRDAGFWLAVTQSSLSWRVTRPLRAAGRLAARVRGRSSS
jgi:hypothetical protein